MYSKGTRSRRKAKTGSVQVRNSNNRLQLVFTHGGKRHFVSLGLSDTPLNQKLAQETAFQVQRDIEYGEFDPSYAKYTVRSALTTVDPVVKIAPAIPTLAGLWEKYVEYRSPNVSPKTINGTYDPVTAHIAKCSRWFKGRSDVSHGAAAGNDPVSSPSDADADLSGL
ncbi:MAG: Arm DNA-binding domain-containing protein [Elainellaceae cyanobacterium]